MLNDCSPAEERGELAQVTMFGRIEKRSLVKEWETVENRPEGTAKYSWNERNTNRLHFLEEKNYNYYGHTRNKLLRKTNVAPCYCGTNDSKILPC